ncbi:hypothetical protein LQF12_05630 [Ruania suaedae]|uniref:hypothetical protein n=1 Tax=Ruania suaedae TaxID=2897774 RepID=UPI001E3613DC|nr:hypothetical protein [Ruania suaedae]UFU04070.1 hypothetical protein LQF12_05630 [Ruania suaedae]
MAQRGGLGPWGVVLVCVDALLIVALVIILVTWPDSGTSQPAPTGDAEATAEADGSDDGESPEAAEDAAADGDEPSQDPEIEVPEDALDVAAFALPSGNIWCEIAADAATCVIEAFSFSPPEVADCAADSVGYRWEVSAEGAGPLCGTAPEQPGDLAELDYGQVTQVGDILCESTEGGPVCRSISSGHGLQIARGGTRTF